MRISVRNEPASYSASNSYDATMDTQYRRILDCEVGKSFACYRVEAVSPQIKQHSRALNVFLPRFISTLCSLTPADVLDLEPTLLRRLKAPISKITIRLNFGLITVIRKIRSKQNLETEFSLCFFVEN